jgi:hypothetical protein
VAIDEHLDRCPVCRAEVAELRSLTRGLGLLSRPTPPADLAGSISNRLYTEAAARRQAPRPSVGTSVARFLKPRLMPYTVGTFASVIMFFLMFTALRPHFVALHEAALQRNAVLMLGTSDFQEGDLRRLGMYDLNNPISPESLAAERAPYGAQSPSLDPAGALAKMTRAYAQPSENYYAPDDDMLVVADVFTNGAASLADVVHPPRDRRMLDDFESALRQNAAFVKASLDGRPDTMRVVFWCRGGAVQKVEVDGRN